MTDMIERVARAASGWHVIFPGMGMGGHAICHGTEAVVEVVCADPRARMEHERAIAILKAMREPTVEMISAGIEKDDDLEWLQQDRAIPQIFTAMIDAALGDKK